jgi:hypothetical protein
MTYGAGDLKLEIEYQTELHGWIHCYLTYGGVRRHLYASNVFSPFPELLDFMRAIHVQRLPHHFLWDEEGRGAKFEALPVAPDSASFRLRIAYEFGEGDVWVDAELDRQAVIDVFSAPLSAFVRHTSSEMQQDWKCTADDMERFYRLLKRQILPRNRNIGVQHFQFEVEGFGEDRFPVPLPLEWLSLSVFDILQVCFSLEDDQIFWPYWFSWLEKIIQGRLPAQFQFHDQDLKLPAIQDDVEETPPAEIEQPGEEVDDEDDFYQYYILQAAPVEDPALFHLKITKSNPWVENQMLIDETFDRHWFASAFCDEFERFLAEEYIYHKEISLFDLRSLPLERLKDLLS